jgi:hypothetical protein
MSQHWILMAAAVVATLVVLHHDRREPFLPLLLAGLAAGGAAGGGAFAFMKSGAMWSKGPVPPNVVSVYKDFNFTGPRRDYPVGTIQNSLSHGKFGISALDSENDTYSSVVVPDGLQAVLFEHNDLRGRSVVLGPGRYPDLRQQNFDNLASSLKVIPANVAANEPVVKFYEHTGFKGRALNLFGLNRIPNLNAMSDIPDGRDNILSSVIVSPGYKVTVWKDVDFKGASTVLTTTASSLPAGWNDAISSLEVSRA